jgi:hypothetical protein
MESQKKIKKGIDYSKGRIYKIVCDTTGLVYIGSTVEALSRRLTKHKANYKYYLKNNCNSKSKNTSYNILKNNNYKIILIQNYPCNSKEELERQERKYIETIECVNKFIPGRTIKEWNEHNKDKIKEQKKEYYKNNKDKIEERQNEKIECEYCKSIFRKDYLKKHQKSMKCKKFQSLVIED